MRQKGASYSYSATKNKRHLSSTRPGNAADKSCNANRFASPSRGSLQATTLQFIFAFWPFLLNGYGMMMYDGQARLQFCIASQINWSRLIYCNFLIPNLKTSRYKAWYMQKSTKGFDYYLQWPGFNVPSWVLDDARAGKLGPLRPQVRCRRNMQRL